MTRHAPAGCWAGPDPFHQLLVRKGDVELGAGQPAIAGIEEQDAARKRAVASGAPRLLVVGLRRGWHGPVHHQADVRLVDAHAEGAGGHDDLHPVGQEVHQRLLPALLGEPRMVRRGEVPCARQLAGERLHHVPGRGVDDRHPVLHGQEPKQRVPPFAVIPHRHDAEPEVPAVEGAEVKVTAPRRTEPECTGDVGTDLRRGAPGEGHALGPPQCPPRPAERPVAGPEVVPPLGDAVGLVNGQEGGLEAACRKLWCQGTEPLR